MPTAAIIPARNEAPSVGEVARVARRSPLIDEVIVVDGGSTDATAGRAGAAGARVITTAGAGKGQAMLTGLAATDADVIVFLDGDLLGLTTHHVDRLARTVASASAVMACGLFDRGPLVNTAALHAAPILTGERALRRELLASLAPDEVAGYRVEAALNCRAGDVGGPVAAFVCHGMFHRTKERKLDTPLQGFTAKVAMLATAYATYARYRRRHGRAAYRRGTAARRLRQRLASAAR